MYRNNKIVILKKALTHIKFEIPKLIPDKIYLKILFKRVTGKNLNLKNPKTFNEKIQWLKLYDRNPLYTKLVDKYAVRDYIKEKLGEEYLIPLVGGPWDSVKEIDFSSLPDQFVLKCTHDSGSVIICRDKSSFDIDAAKEKLKRAMKINIYWFQREWAYKNVKPRIIAEKYMVDESGYDLKDYKIYNFDGEPQIIQVDFDRFTDHHRHNYYTTEWEYIDAQILCPSDPSVQIDPPERYSEMLEVARQLSAGFPHVRTDFYYVQGKIYFGELTFYSNNGMAKFTPETFGYKMGNYIKLRKYMQ